MSDTNEFIQKTWADGETITKEKLNRMEGGIAEAIAKAGQKVAGSGWEGNQRLATDETGAVVAKPDPVTVDEEGRTSIDGLRRLKNWSVVRDGQTITVNTTLEGGEAHTDVITLDDDYFPVKIVSDGVEASGTWEGF